MRSPCRAPRNSNGYLPAQETKDVSPERKRTIFTRMKWVTNSNRSPTSSNCIFTFFPHSHHVKELQSRISHLGL